MVKTCKIVAVCLVEFCLLTAVVRADNQVFFSPQGGCEQEIVKSIIGAKQAIDAAVYSVNNKGILEALKTAHKKGVKIRLLLDRTQSFGNREETLSLRDTGIDVRIHSKNRIQHNKFAIFDGKAVVTGSFNWTNPAESSNEENCLFSDKEKTVSAFKSRFNGHLWVVNSIEKSNQSFSRLEQGSTKTRKPTSESIGNNFYK